MSLMDLEKFLQERKELFNEWDPQVYFSLDESCQYLRSLPDEKNAALTAVKARNDGKTLLCPSMGVESVELHRELLNYADHIGGVDVVTTYLDSLTRNNRYKDVAAILENNRKTGTTALNGFPVVNHGVDGCRNVTASIRKPNIIFGPSPDPRLALDIGLAGGMSGYSAGPLISFWNYTKSVSFRKVGEKFQYVNRLMGYYEENNIPVLYCVSGAMPANSPPSLFAAPEILEALIAAEQGVRHIQINCWLQGNFIQDLALISVLPSLMKQYLNNAGFHNVELTTFAVCPTGRFPEKVSEVYGLISYFAMISLMGRVQMIGSRTIDEARHLPSKEGTAESFQALAVIRNIMAQQIPMCLNEQSLESEKMIMTKEIRMMVDKSLEMGNGDILEGISRAIECGILDQPYSTSQLVKSQVLGIKDESGACRFFDCGLLPFDEEIKDFHMQHIKKRESLMGVKSGYDMIISDLTALSKGRLTEVKF